MFSETLEGKEREKSYFQSNMHLLLSLGLPYKAFVVGTTRNIQPTDAHRINKSGYKHRLILQLEVWFELCSTAEENKLLSLCPVIHHVRMARPWSK
ncbi:MAG: hypothetical protein DSY43_00305 [Gammaproteobacteria bacterium]|nr:MAG: hypothetical protein DSY43_00305 [Gammaproteobacteria bacterium]